jgi:hypothetical protein
MLRVNLFNFFLNIIHVCYIFKTDVRPLHYKSCTVKHKVNISNQ